MTTAWQMAEGRLHMGNRKVLSLRKRFFLLFTFAICHLPFAMPSAYAAFEDKGTGARGTALGDTYVAMGDDVLSLAYNPAALARVHGREVTSEYAKLFTGLSDNSNLAQSYLAYGQPIKWGGTMAFSYKQFGLDNLYTERTLSLGYGEWLTSDIAIGGALKQLYHSFGVPNMVVDNNGNVQSGTPNFFAQNGNSQTAYSSDLGMLYRWTEQHTLGISILDVNEPNIALSPADHEIVPRTIRMALSYERNRHLNLAGALQTRQSLSNQNDLIATGAAERTWDMDDGDRVAVRGSLADGSREFRQLAIGAGYQLGKLQFDYAFVFNLGGVTIGDTSGTHRFSITYRFGPVNYPAKTKAPAKPKAPQAMPEGYEPAVHQAPQPTLPPKVLPRAVDITIMPEEKEASKAPPRAAEITITPEEIGESKAPPKAADILIDAIFDSDFDGVPDDRDLCPNTPPGMEVDANGCAQTQIDHHGNPLPHNVELRFLSPEKGSNGR
jgi:hypothetical protein